MILALTALVSTGQDVRGVSLFSVLRQIFSRLQHRLLSLSFRCDAGRCRASPGLRILRRVPGPWGRRMASPLQWQFRLRLVMRQLDLADFHDIATARLRKPAFDVNTLGYE